MNSNIKWQTLKRRIANEIYTNIKCQRGNYDAQILALFDAVACRRTVQESVAELADQCYHIIMNWDVRSVVQLRTIFPEHFPKFLHNGKLGAYQDDAADSAWIIYRMSPA